ncbi:uncharacterized protein A1O9_06483 [Exophiala aquamarina CBS 119918]|uniref:Transcription factor domain-containing protein n=1 Tax=Exophiala aquamarina CBS 119918 TaxID=1182545 RepID=A0A072PFL1_9EURO|nr:uncharacterized protein A1O9_06483 [Exophiala aquamarina CBS 119918]KEF58557.1 hypothetical protein A1O9_06483 [Exophiala aquamarina CBS 119918]
MPIGRPRLPGTEAERVEARRAKVRANVQAFRRRQKEKKLAEDSASPESGKESTPPMLIPRSQSSSPLPPLTNLSLEESQSLDSSDVEFKNDPKSWLWAIDSEMGLSISGTSYEDEFLTALPRKYQASKSISEQMHCAPSKTLTICCSTWSTSATLRIGSCETDVLMEALAAASLAIIGREGRDEEMALQAAYVQSRALRRLRNSITQYEEGDGSVDPIILSLTALTCAMSELIANQSWTNFNRHLLGVGALMFHRGPEALDKQSTREHFYGYRAVQTPFLFMDRQWAFLSDPEWIQVPWKKNLEAAQQPLHSMLDIALYILPEIVQQDMTKKWRPSILRERLQKAWNAVAELDSWERSLRSQHRSGLYNKKHALWEGLEEAAFDFTSLCSAIAFTMYTAVRIHVANLIASISDDLLLRDPQTDVRPQAAMLEAFRWARIACQCLEFFHTGKPKVSGRIITLWPLEAAWELFSRLQADKFIEASKEMAWCQRTAERLSSTGVPPFRWR